MKYKFKRINRIVCTVEYSAVQGERDGDPITIIWEGSRTDHMQNVINEFCDLLRANTGIKYEDWHKVLAPFSRVEVE